MDDCLDLNTFELVRKMQDTLECNFVERVLFFRAQNGAASRCYESRVKMEMKAELLKSITEAECNEIIDWFEEDDFRVDNMVTTPTDASATILLKFFVSCKPLIYIFIMSYFCPEKRGVGTLLHFYRSCSTRQQFTDEMYFLYLFRVDTTVIISIQSAFEEACVRLKHLDELYKSSKSKGKKKNNDSEASTSRSSKNNSITIPEILSEGHVFGSMESRCPLATAETNIILAKLVIIIPFILYHWSDLILSTLLFPYQRIIMQSERLHPATPIGLYVHLLYLTPTHLRLTLSDIESKLYKFSLSI